MRQLKKRRKSLTVEAFLRMGLSGLQVGSRDDVVARGARFNKAKPLKCIHVSGFNFMAEGWVSTSGPTP